MLLLHAAPQEDGLFVWGEASGDAPKGRKRARKSVGPIVSPFDAGADRCRDELERAIVGLTLQGAVSAKRLLWAPSTGGTPLASSSLIAELAPANGELVIAPWLVSGLILPADAAVAVLCACWDKEMLAPGVGRGATLAYCAIALRFVGSLVARQQFLPGIGRDGKQWRAVWQPVLAGEDARRMGRLAECMPTACRAITAESEECEPTISAAARLGGFVNGMVDHLVRRGSANGPLPMRLDSAPRRAQSFDSVHDQWLHALRSPEGTLHGAEAELASLSEQVREWQRPIGLSVSTPFRLSFRLEEPVQANGAADGAAPRVKPAAGTWHVRYLLQAVDDPSLLIAAADAWGPNTQGARLLKRNSFKPREYMLSALGSAAGLVPEVERSLKTARPAGYDLDTTAAYAFLTEKAWLLEQSGFGVLLPAWWTRKGTKNRLTVRAEVKTPSMQGHARLSLDELIDFRWQVALGDDPITQQELELLARMKVPLVMIRGKWVQLTADEIQAALAYWKQKGEQETTTVRDLVRMSLGALQPARGLEFAGVTASGWIAELMQQLDGRSGFDELAVPPDFRGTLRPYQVRGYSWLGFLRRWGLGACLADDMGLGKTVQALALIQGDWHADPGAPVLLVCPMSVVGNWQKEAERFTPDLPVLVHHGLKRCRTSAAFRKAVEGKALVLSSYALLHRDFEHLKTVPWRGVVLDEAQNIKNPETKQAKAARGLETGFRIALTGTPVENHVGDLWSLMEFLNPGFLGSQAEFRRTFYYPIHTNSDPEASSRLRRLTGPFMLRRLKTDKDIIADLPEKLEMKVYCNLTREQASLYAAVVEDASKALDKTEGIQRKGVVLATLSKLKQVCNHPAHFLGDNSPLPGRSGKLARLTEMLEELLEEGDRALVFTQFTEMGTLLRKHLQETLGQEVLFLHGELGRKQRDLAVQRFQAEGGPRIFLLSLKAGGTGLNLTAANHVFHYDRWWNPAVENQATDRAFRIGQKKNVQVHKFICAGTLEEKIDAIIESKTAVAQQVVGAGEGWLTELSTAELKEIFALRQDALGE